MTNHGHRLLVGRRHPRAFVPTPDAHVVSVLVVLTSADVERRVEHPVAGASFGEPVDARLATGEPDDPLGERLPVPLTRPLLQERAARLMALCPEVELPAPKRLRVRLPGGVCTGPGDGDLVLTPPRCSDVLGRAGLHNAIGESGLLLRLACRSRYVGTDGQQQCDHDKYCCSLAHAFVPPTRGRGRDAATSQRRSFCVRCRGF